MFSLPVLLEDEENWMLPEPITPFTENKLVAFV